MRLCNYAVYVDNVCVIQQFIECNTMYTHFSLPYSFFFIAFFLIIGYFPIIFSVIKHQFLVFLHGIRVQDLKFLYKYGRYQLCERYISISNPTISYVTDLSYFIILQSNQTNQIMRYGRRKCYVFRRAIYDLDEFVLGVNKCHKNFLKLENLILASDYISNRTK